MPKVKIYTTPTCPYCAMAKAFFKENKIPYEEIDVASNQKALDEMVSKSGQIGVPVIEIDGKIIIGFDRPALAKALKLEQK
ncbi:MAG: glutaredoxin family protein [Candidatus Woesearchaeota archaeon]